MNRQVTQDDITLVIINNGCNRMPSPIPLSLNTAVIPQRAVNMITGGLKHWKTGQPLLVQNGQALVAVEGKTIDIFYLESL